jgi:Arf-GAP/coiled-coil/ANK repeat/PH domain-containing protein
MESLGEACLGDHVFAESLEAFGGDQDDPVSISIGGPIMSKFISVFRELATFKELLRSQAEHVLVDRVSQFLSSDLHDVKESRRRLDKATHSYDQARDRFASLKKNARDEVVAELEEDLHNSKSSYDRSRFNLVSALMNIESKKKYDFLESFSAIMDAHLRYFKLGYDLLSQLEPFIHQVLTYAQQSKEMASAEQDKLAKRIQEFRTQAEMDQMRASSNLGASTTDVGINGVGMSSNKNIDALMQSTAKGRVQTIKQGYLLKRSSNLRASWKRRFFVLDSHGDLYYHGHRTTKNGSNSVFHGSGSTEQLNSVFSRFRARHFSEEDTGSNTVDLCTSTIKIDAEDSDLRLCFRIISPSKTYTLQAESEADRIDWVNKISGVIASLLNSQMQQSLPGMLSKESRNGDYSIVSYDDRVLEDDDDDGGGGTVDDGGVILPRPESVSTTLREIPGNDLCAECSAPDPDWASLNLGILMCIQCSGIHRNLGVHVSKVRSIRLDVKVWEPTILDLFRALGNSYCNSLWESLLRLDKEGLLPVTKPSPKDAIRQKETFILAKYVEKLLVKKETSVSTTRIWEAVKADDIREVYRLLVTSPTSIINTVYDEVAGGDLLHQHDSEKGSGSDGVVGKKQFDPASCRVIKDSKKPGKCLQGCSLLHLACHSRNAVMVELLLQHGADINKCDFHGRTPLHHCIFSGNNRLAKFLIRRGAKTSLKDRGGLGALERAMEMGAITDDELFILLST